MTEVTPQRSAPSSSEIVWKVRWHCPRCDRILRKPPAKSESGARYHSWKCQVPMVKVSVILRPI